MKDKDEKKPLDGTAGAAKQEPGAPKQETPGVTDKAAENPGAGKEEEKKPDAPDTQDSDDAAQAGEKNADGKVPDNSAKNAEAGAQGSTDSTDADPDKAAGKSEADAGGGAEPGADAAGVGGEPGTDGAADGGEDPEKEALRRELLAARSRLAAYGAGVVPEMVADAVMLATAGAQAAGDVSAESIAKAMEGVLKRHPEWKACDPGRAGGDGSGGGKKTAGAGRAGGPSRAGGFKLGVDPGRVPSAGGEDSEAKSAKRWNRFK